MGFSALSLRSIATVVSSNRFASSVTDVIDAQTAQLEDLRFRANVSTSVTGTKSSAPNGGTVNQQTKHVGNLQLREDEKNRRETGRQLQTIDCVAEAMGMEAACCDAADADGDGCSGFPTACSAVCATSFFAFDAACQSFVNELDEARRTGFAGLRAECDATASEVASGSARAAAFDFTTAEGEETACLVQPCLIDGICLNGGNCVAEAGSDFRCDCAGEWSGARCENSGRGGGGSGGGKSGG